MFKDIEASTALHLQHRRGCRNTVQQLLIVRRFDLSVREKQRVQDYLKAQIAFSIVTGLKLDLDPRFQGARECDPRS